MTFQDYFDYNEKLLRWFGVWRLDKEHRFYKLQKYAYWVFFPLACLHVASIAGGFGYRTPEYTFGPLSFQFMCLNRIAFMWYNEDKLKGCIAMVKRRSFWFEEDDLKEIKQSNEDLANKFSLKYLNGFLLLMLFDLPPSFFGTMAYNLFLLYGNSNAELLSLPYATYFPFNVTHGYNYFYAWTSQMFFVDYLSFSFPVTDTLLLGLVVHSIYQIKTLKRCILYLAEIDVVSREDELKHKIRFVKINQELQAIYKLIYKIEDIYNVNLMLQLFLSTLLFCSFFLIVKNDPSIIIKVTHSFTLCGIALQPLTLCYISQTLTDELVELDQAFASLNWLQFSKDYRSSLLFVIYRVQKPVVLTLGKYLTINLSLYIGFASKSYSFYTILTQAN